MDTQSRAHTARQDHLHEGSAAHATTDSNVESSARPSSRPRPILFLPSFVDLPREDQARIDAQDEAYFRSGGTTSQPPVSNSQEGPASLLPLHIPQLTRSRSPNLFPPPSFTPPTVSLSLPLAEYHRAPESVIQQDSNTQRIIMRFRQELRQLGLEELDALRIAPNDREPAMARPRTGPLLPSKQAFLESGLTACEVEAEDNECDICKEPFERPVKLPCGHVYCSACIGTWLKEKNTCPMDRKMLFSPPTIHGADMVSVGMRI